MTEAWHDESLECRFPVETEVWHDEYGPDVVFTVVGYWRGDLKLQGDRGTTHHASPRHVEIVNYAA